MEGVIARPPLPAGPYLVVGLARSGVAAAEALAGGLRGHGHGRAPGRRRRARRARRRGRGGARRRGGRRPPRGIATIVKSPGVPREAPVIAAALAAGIHVIGELELGWRLLEHEFIALTGSNGKTTTVELIGHIHRVAGLPVTVAGNVGTALTSLPGTLEPGATVVCEASSFQLEDTEAFAPEAAVLLNLAEDHLDRHGTFDNYRAAKLEIFAHQPPGTLAVVPAGLALDDAGGAADADHVRRRRRGAGSLPPRRDAVLARRAADARRRDPYPRPAQPRERDGGGGGLPRSRGRPEAVARGSRRSPASRTGSRRSARSAASCTSTTRRPRTSRRPRSGSARSRAACT